MYCLLATLWFVSAHLGTFEVRLFLENLVGNLQCLLVLTIVQCICV